jgi:hypothetical protein
MLADVDKLRHGPPFELCEIEVFDGRQARPQFMVVRDIIQVVRELFANPRTKNSTIYAPERVWTSPSKKVRAYGDANACDWWWNEQVSVLDARVTNEMNSLNYRSHWRRRGNTTLRLGH